MGRMDRVDWIVFGYCVFMVAVIVAFNIRDWRRDSRDRGMFTGNNREGEQ